MRSIDNTTKVVAGLVLAFGALVLAGCAESGPPTARALRFHRSRMYIDAAGNRYPDLWTAEELDAQLAKEFRLDHVDDQAR